MTDHPIHQISLALKDSGIGIYRVEDEAIVKTGGRNLDAQAWYGISVRLDNDEAFVVELELTLERHLAESVREAEADLRGQFEAITDEAFLISTATLDPVWGYWCCTVSRRCHSTDEAIGIVREMLGWEC